MDLINKYLNLSEAWPGTPEWKKKHDPSYNPYDPEGKVKKALKLKPYGYRDSKPASDEEETPSEQPAMKKRGRPKKMREEAEQIEESAKETATRARELSDKLSKKNPEKSKMYRDMANQALSRISSGVGNPKQGSYRDIEGGGNKSLRRQGIEPAGKSPVFPFRKEEIEEAEQIEELKSSTMMSYKDKANKEIKALDTEVKTGEYKDIAGKIMDRRMKGVDRAANKLNDRRRSNAKLAQRGTFPYSEEVELEEISNMAHAKYRSAARADIRAQSKMLDADNKASDRIEKRVDGLARSTGLERVKKMTKEEVVQKYLNVEQADDVPFKADKPKQSATPGKYGAGYSTARHLARMGLKAAIKDLKKGPEAGKKQIS